MHIRFDHERIRARPQRIILREPLQAQALAHHQLVQDVQQLRREQADIADHAAVGELPLAEGARQAHDAAHVDVLVGEFGEAVEIAVEGLLEQGQHEHDPQRHAGAAEGGVDLGRGGLLLRVGGVGAVEEVLLEQREDLLAQRDVAVEVLDSLEGGGDVVAAGGVDLDLLDGDFAEGKLVGKDDAHGAFGTKMISNSMKYGSNDHQNVNLGLGKMDITSCISDRYRIFSRALDNGVQGQALSEVLDHDPALTTTIRDSMGLASARHNRAAPHLFGVPAHIAVGD